MFTFHCSYANSLIGYLLKDKFNCSYVTENIARSSFPGYFAAEASFLQSHNDLRGVPPEYLQKPVLPLRPGGYGLDDIGGIGGRPASGLGGLTSGLNIHGFPTSLEDSALISQRQDVAPGISPGISDILNETPGSLRKVNGLLTEESNILFINGLPADCTRREVGRIL
ncbi:hypothetical protein GIB67_041712 [Kingdonia uniflora]|uniref:RNA-binding protein n=1 Tax=Kingdonia uniflora TaxID=39325 RepID=A0A7J7MQT9_9MAGN|nr:hypothetical protein GIB67_041712 [Kingdonia uniflora]